MSQYRIKNRVVAVLCLLLSVLLLRAPALAAKGFAEGLRLCVETVLPALFPFFVLCEWLISLRGPHPLLRRVSRFLGFGREEGVLALLLSWFGGYAVCARLTGRLTRNGTLTERESAFLLMLGCCSSPGFVIGCVGGLMLGSLKLGVLLYALQLAANLISTLACLPLLPARRGASGRAACADTAEPAGFSLAVSSAVSSCLNVCGCVVFFRTLAAAAEPFLPHIPQVRPLLSALQEITAGCADFAALGGRAALYGCCLCLSVLGLSVWAQLALLLQGAASLRLLALNRLLHLLLLPALTAGAVRLLPGVLPVYRSLPARVIPAHRLAPDAALVAFLFLCAALYKLRQNFYNRKNQ